MNKVKLLLLAMTVTLSLSSTAMSADVQEGSLAFARCQECINVRSDATTESSVIGYLYDNCAVTIINVLDDGWCEISSGDVYGYVSQEYLVSGDYAWEIANDLSTDVAVILAETLNIRMSPNEESDVLDTACYGEELELLSYDGEWATIRKDGSYGFINGEYFEIKTYYPVAISAYEDNFYSGDECDYSPNEEYVEDEYVEEICAVTEDVEMCYEDYSDYCYDEYQYVEDVWIDDVGDIYVGDIYVGNESEVQEIIDSGDGSYGQSIVDYALQFVGNPYVWGGTSLTNGADCSGFTQSILGNFGININRVASDQALGGTQVALDDIQAGDLLFYSDGSGISHVAIYMGDGAIVHAANSEQGIIVSDAYYDTPIYATRYSM